MWFEPMSGIATKLFFGFSLAKNAAKLHPFFELKSKRI